MKIILLLALSLSAMASSLEVKVNGFKNYRGDVQIALWNSSVGFPDDYNTSYITKTEGAKANFSTIIRNLEPGTYAVAMYHDKNSNSKMDTNFLGIPKEGFGFSNNPRILTGAPGFHKVKFTIEKNQKKVINIRLKHF
jgi:uncharacterized protein (DUF2141 family)